MAGVLVESILLFFAIKVPFECMLNHQRRNFGGSGAGGGGRTGGALDSSFSRSKGQGKSCCRRKRVALVIIICMNGLVSMMVVALQVLFKAQLTLLWLLLFVGGAVFYFIAFEGAAVGISV